MKKKAEKLQQLMAEIRILQGKTVIDFYEQGKRWKIIHDEKLYKAPHVHSFREFCEKEACCSHATVYHFIAIYEKYGGIIENKLAQGHVVSCEVTRLIKAIPYIKENAEDWLIKAETLSKGDFDSEIKEAQRKVPKDSCNHEEVELWNRCVKCGTFFKTL